jgi:plasmid maintenance system antidote protein VapI
LHEDFLKPLGMSVNKLALALGVPAMGIGKIVNRQRAITSALRGWRTFSALGRNSK